MSRYKITDFLSSHTEYECFYRFQRHSAIRDVRIDRFLQHQSPIEHFFAGYNCQNRNASSFLAGRSSGGRKREPL
jgi:hypothetical protein